VTTDETPMPQRLERFLAEVEPELAATVVSYRPISGGYSRVTALVDISTADGGAQKLVLRSDPRGDKGVFTSDRDREWPLLQAMWEVDTIEIPRPRWYDGTGERLGTKTIVMDHVEGSALQSTLGQGANVATARTVFLEVAAALVRTPIDALPADIERPTDWDSYIDSAIDIYARAESELSDSSPIIRYVAAWLRANKPPPVPLSIVHGDFQPGNILVADGRPPVVIDWEFTRIGDPREDIGYYSGNPLPHSLYTIDPEAFLAQYRELTGFTEEQVNPEVMEYFFILGMAELFVQMMQGADAVSRGQAKGIMSPFLVNSMCYFHEKYLDICGR
jgi:aminoglycoside phosphotransferase (APT) family kinase protein